jgi:hypothetical protein
MQEHTAKRHPFHVLPHSPWPLMAGWGSFVACLGASRQRRSVATGRGAAASTGRAAAHTGHGAQPTARAQHANACRPQKAPT